MTHATRFRLLGAAAALALSLGCAQAIAQPTHDQESVTPYAYLKGWDVMSVNVDGFFIGCRGAHYGESGPFMIDYNPEGWRILVAYRGGTDEGTFAGAVLKVDRTVVDAQVGLDLPHWAMMFLEDGQLKLLRDGSVASLTVNGQPPWSQSCSAPRRCC